MASMFAGARFRRNCRRQTACCAGRPLMVRASTRSGNLATTCGLNSWVKNRLRCSNVSDMRDWFTFHQTPLWVGTAYWRVRAVRLVYGTLQNGHPIASFGPWSPVFQTHATPPTATPLTLGGTTSDVIGTVAKPAAHKLMPGFSWSGNTSGGVAYELYRVYVFSDEIASSLSSQGQSLAVPPGSRA